MTPTPVARLAMRRPDLSLDDCYRLAGMEVPQ